MRKTGTLRHTFENRIPPVLLWNTFGFAIVVGTLLVWRGLAFPGATILAVVGFIALTLAFARLTVYVTEDAVRWRFALPIIAGEVPLHAIRETSIDEYRWLYGYGYRWTGKGPLVRAWGYRVVHLARDGGRVTALGADDPDGLKQAIDAARAARTARLNNV